MPVHGLIQRQVIAVHQHRCARVLVKLAQPADVIDMSVRADDGFDRQFVPAKEVQDTRDLVAGIDDQRFARDWIADDGTVALQHPHGDGDVDQSFRGGIQSRQVIAHEQDYIIGVERICGRHTGARGSLWYTE